MKERNIGLLSTLACYILWGLLPLYWHVLEDLDSIFILCNRIIWSAVFTIVILLITKKFSEVKAVFYDKKKMRFMKNLIFRMRTASAVLNLKRNSLNWVAGRSNQTPPRCCSHSVLPRTSTKN